MINVNQITSRLASMPDQALQQYAAMHKNDPYVMALALSESNRRKQIRQGAQMQAPQQPKVVDQELAQMSQPMPEDTGIGQLPAPNMQSMAEGGIVAFQSGGGTGGVLGDIPGYAPGVTSFNLPQPGVEDPNSLTTWEKLKRWNERGIAERKLKEVNAARAQAGLPPIAQTGVPPAPAAPYDAATATRRSTFLEKAPPPPPPPDKNKSPLSALVQKPPPAPAPAAPAGLATTPEAVATDMAAMQARQKTENPFAKQIEELTASERDTLTKEKEQFEADIEKAGPAFKEREERLKKRGEKLSLEQQALFDADLPDDRRAK